ncbi:helix-turn-helix transcriptional regulator [Streptomyces sp. NPDC050095]|uniref:helix-turn-helix domain-containing protein n=1 Tax=unclassified Streptomyces TaxID=2593676 RepID=UPI0034246B9D
MAGDDFAALLRELKDRSGLSYGTLAKRLHMSTSTLHRYCNGTAVPTDYAPVERLARLCKASPQELVELHRRWILADAARGRRATAEAPVTEPAVVEPAVTEAAVTEPAVTEPAVVEAPEELSVATDLPGVPEPGPRPRSRRRRTALIASIAAAAVLGAVALAVNLHTGGGDADDQKAVGATARTSGPAGRTHGATASPSASGAKRSASAAPSTSAPKRGTTTGPAAPPTGSGDAAATPLTVSTRPYVYDNPCSQHFLVDSEPGQVGPPAPTEQDAPRWAASYGAVSSGEQRVALTVQGTGKETVVLTKLYVNVVSTGAPLAWNDYSMGVGCGGGVGTKSFDVDLDNGRPTVTAKNGQRDFPYKVSESDPEVFYVNAHTTGRDVRWNLSLEWTSGDRHGTVRINNDGTPFRTSANTDRPGYDYPLGGSEWIKREEQ